MHAHSLQSCLTLWDPMYLSPPGSSVHGILQARILEWVAMPSSRGSSWPRDRTGVSCISCIAGRLFTTQPLGRSKYIDCKNNVRHGVLEDNWCLWIWNATTIHWLEWGNYQVINAVLAGSYFVKHVMITSPENTQVLFETHKWTLAVEMGAVWDINLVDLVIFP